MSQLRFVTAASLFDGHDVSINIIRRLLQSRGVEVIHLGHNRSALEVVSAALQEDVHAVALSSYQGGHNEYFAYIRELLNQAGASNIKIFGGGGGVITPTEIKVLESRYGIEKIYTPDDGSTLGLDGIIDDMIKRASGSTLDGIDLTKLHRTAQVGNLDHPQLAKIITEIEDLGNSAPTGTDCNTPVLGITGTGGAGKSSLIDELLLRFHHHLSDKKIALISVDPTRKRGQGALLGDRIRLGCAIYPNFFIRSLATRNSRTELSPKISEVISFMRGQNFDLIMVESSGIGQAADEITKVADYCLYVMTPEYGAATQLEKIEMLESADMIVLNKFEKPRAEDALRDIRRQYRRNHKLFPGHPGDVPDEELPIFATMASKFNDQGINSLFANIVSHFAMGDTPNLEMLNTNESSKQNIISPERALYLRDITSACRNYKDKTQEHLKALELYQSLLIVAKTFESSEIKKRVTESHLSVAPLLEQIEQLDKLLAEYSSGKFSYTVRGKEYQVDTKFTSLSHLAISKVARPKLSSLVDKYNFLREQNLPGFFPFAAGIFPFKRSDEDPKRMFAGEGGPKRTNKRFHYLSANDPAKRLSTAFDSVTLYGDDPDRRPDIFGKIGEAGVSIATLDDMNDLFSGFNLVDPNTSVSMTINGPAPIILAMFMNTAIKQQLSEGERDDPEKCLNVMRQVRGTVQADILKEDQAQNTCIFSLEFALRMMGDVQEYFCQHKIKNYYTVSISGYHIAEAGANPISQLAFTLANGFTYVEYYLSRGMKIDDFCGNLSYFFSNGLDPEYTVLGRVARKIWAITMRDKYNANEKSQKFKYHVQTSGRSLHAQEIDFNDIRTTLQAFLALSDNCNSLHTNAYDEAITTPTEESVRRAMAIQMIIGKEFGMNKCDNPLQGSYLYEELCDLVEEAVLKEFDSISDRGGVLGAMESMYQRSKIQEESLHYESLKDSGKLPIIGVNTYLANQNNGEERETIELSRCTDQEKQDQIDRLENFKQRHESTSSNAKEQLIKGILDGGNIFAELLNTTRHCSLGEITHVLYQLGGRYRRNM